jgi:rhodanese-related sulfurtransferase
MSQLTFAQLVNAALPQIHELMPWDLDAMRQAHPDLLVIDIREADEYAAGHIQGSLLVPRGVLESACDWGYPDTLPALVQARTQPVVLVCRSGNRTALAALTLQQMGYDQVFSLKTGVRGWNDFELPLVNNQGEPVDIDVADEALSPPVLPTQMAPKLVKTSQ